MIRTNLLLALFALSTACSTQQASQLPTLTGFHSLPADSFREGPAAGHSNGKTPNAAISANGRQAPFNGQPVQGFSAVQLAENSLLFLSDNGFGSDKNSGDYLLSIYHMQPSADQTLALLNTIELTDPNNLAPFVSGFHLNGKKHLTGADFDPESFIRMANGDFWVGDEFGPFLLQFNAQGELIHPPIATPNVIDTQLSTQATVQSPNNPLLGGAPNIPGSGGFEGMAFTDGKLYPLLEKTVEGDPADSLRLYEFDPRHRQFSSFMGFYPAGNTLGRTHAIGDITAVNTTQFLVIERDHFEADKAQFKRVFLIDTKHKDDNGFFHKTQLVDLLNISDPKDLNNDQSTVYTMPFVTIESIAALDERTILIANDNNYPFSRGRKVDIDNSEVVTIQLPDTLPLLTR